MSDAMTTLTLERIQPSKTNPRRSFDGPAMHELVESVKRHGVLQPILVRPVDGHYEIVAGERRYRAAKTACAATIPVTVRTLSDQEALELQCIENLQRQDLHQLEEAEGYRQLLALKGYDAARIAERVGRSVKYIYDRIKLLQLIEPIRKVFLEGRITAGHAILLARLTPKDQTRVIGKGPDDLGGLWQGQRLLWSDREDEQDDRKAVSVRELEAWIDEHVRFDPAKADEFLFPETTKTVTVAREQAEKVVSITHDNYVQESARTNERIIGPRSWTRADGSRGAKRCDYAVTGVIVVGFGRGEAFKVCINKEKCKAHWPQFHKDRAERAKEAAKGGGTAEERWKKQEKQREADQVREKAERARWEQARPAILKAVAEAVKKLPAKANSLIGRIVLGEIREHNTPHLASYVPLGTTAEDLLRHAAFKALASEVGNSWSAPREFPKRAKLLGIDVKKILDEAAPVEKPVHTSAPADPAKAPKKT